jgi:flagellar operon protein
MSEIINGIQVPFVPIGGTSGPQKGAGGLPTERSFDAIFEREFQKIQFSKHAQERLQTRNITLSDDEMRRLGDAVEKAGSKGGRDSLVLMDGKAFIVNVPNRVVVTALDGAALKDNVFTNIDSAVVAV